VKNKGVEGGRAGSCENQDGQEQVSVSKGGIGLCAVS
jgi:hypothetical protein